jgi:hypothetical protein
MSQATHPSPPTPPEPTASISRDDIYEMLGNQRRRYALHYLEWKAPETIDLRDLAEHVASWEYEKPVAELVPSEQKRVQTALHQFHLPKLDESGFLEYDTKRQRITLTDEATDLRVYLDVVPGRSVPWGILYLGITLLSSVALACTWLNIGPFTAVTDLAWSLFFLVTIGVTASVHSYHSFRMRLGRSAEPPEVNLR